MGEDVTQTKGRAIEETRDNSSPDHYYDYYNELLNDFSNEIPEKIYNGKMTEGREYKVRHNWFQLLAGKMSVMDADNLLHNTPDDPDLVDDAWDFMNYYNSDEFVMRNTTKDDLDNANHMLKRLIKSLEPRLKRSQAA